MNDKKKLPSRVRNAILIKQVCLQQWPETFNPQAIKPLAAGIHMELRAALPKAPHNGINSFLHHWTNNAKYLFALRQPGAIRIHLDGSPAEPVSEQHRQSAIDELKARSTSSRMRQKTRNSPA